MQEDVKVNRKSPVIFVVEDNQVYSKLLVSYLKSNKYTNVKAFFSGEECLKHLDEKPDIIVQDYLLEGMNGIEVLKRSKQVDPAIDFIFLSGQDNIDVAINTMKYGAYDYIIKDQMALKKLVAKIQNITSMRKLERTNKRYKTGVILFFALLAAIVVVILSLTLFFPEKFNF